MKLSSEWRRLHYVGIKSRPVLSMERVTRSFGRMIGDNELQRTSDTARESQGLSANEGERRGSQHPGVRTGEVMSERRPEEGVPQAGRPRLRQVGCETCCLRLEQYPRLRQLLILLQSETTCLTTNLSKTRSPYLWNSFFRTTFRHYFSSSYSWVL